jgi:hypothetical protein
MPTVKYMSRSIKYRVVEGSQKRERVEYFQRIAANVKNVAALPAIAAKKSFVRWCCGGLSMEELVQRRKADGRSDWYA